MYNQWPNNPAQIYCKRHELALERYSVEYEWRGESQFAVITGGMIYDVAGQELKSGREFWIGQFNLLVVDHDYVRDLVLCSLVDGRAFQYFYSHKLYRGLSRFWYRFIMTLHIWGLAYVPIHETPSRKHIGKHK